jgi:hypothetical protein
MKHVIGLVVLPAEVPAANRQLSSVWRFIAWRIFILHWLMGQGSRHHPGADITSTAFLHSAG